MPKTRPLYPLAVALSALWIVVCQSAMAQEHAEDERIARVIRDDGRALQGERMKLWYPERMFGELEARAFLSRLETDLTQIERLLDRPVDAAHYGNRQIEVILSPQAGVSHIYGSYHQKRYDKPWIFLLPKLVKERRSPYSHEMTHLVAWRFQAHSLREGLACWVQIKLVETGQGLNTNVHGFANRQEADRQSRDALRNGPAALLEAMGADGLPDRSLTAVGGGERADYYALSYSFVAFLIDKLGLPGFMKLYEAPSLHDPAAVGGNNIQDLRREWVAYLGASI